ncbi:MAG: hypothetical protein LBE32_00315 [Burkholderiales bacterium]|jgi:hypothetical protein|nr:hypothetical protein [Burkholderiales bacterium]
MRTARKTRRPTSLDDAIQMCADHAAEKLRRPAKVLADLMGVELKTYYRWLADSAMPLNRLRQFEAFCGCGYISEYLCVSCGRVVIDIPMGRGSSVATLSAAQSNSAQAFALLSKFYEGKASAEETVEALSITLSDLAYQRQNVIKHAEPELGLFGDKL